MFTPNAAQVILRCHRMLFVIEIEGNYVEGYSWPFAHTYPKLVEVGACNSFFDGDGSGER